MTSISLERPDVEAHSAGDDPRNVEQILDHLILQLGVALNRPDRALRLLVSKPSSLVKARPTR